MIKFKKMMILKPLVEQEKRVKTGIADLPKYEPSRLMLSKAWRTRFILFQD
jgi:hypothetical protein